MNAQPNICLPEVGYRFGNRTHLEQFLNCGAVSFGHARLYFDDNLASGQRDDELQRKHRVRPNDGRIAVAPLGQPPIEVTGVLEERLKVKQPDYYMLCFALTFDERLYKEFISDACVEIVNFPEFFTRLDQYVASTMPGWYLTGRAVEYWDGDSVPIYKDEPIRRICSKSFRFAYQKEYRLILWNAAGPSGEDRKTLIIGCLADICRITYRD
jgi:hypothetical protein